MPIPVAAAGAIAGTLGSVPAIVQTAWENRQQRRFAREMYQRQYDDNLTLWHLQNQYNSPQAQMNRFQEAGLNKNLVYSQGNPGNASGISAPNPVRPEFTPLPLDKLNPMGSLMLMYDLEQKQAGTDNMKIQNSILHEELALRRVQGLEAWRRYEMESDLQPITMEARREALRKLRTDIDLSINEDARRAVQLSTNVMEAAQRIENMRTTNEEIKQRIQNMKRDGTLKDLEIGLRRSGLTFHDELWQRLVAKFLSSGGYGPASRKILEGMTPYKPYFDPLDILPQPRKN